MLSVSCGFLGAPNAQVLLSYHGPVIKVDLGFDPGDKPTNKSLPKPQVKGVETLVDTGARESCIDSALAQELGLPIVDRRNVSGVNGLLEVDFHLAQIHIPSLRFILRGRFAGVPLVSSGFQQRVVVGRSLLSYVKLEYDGPLGDVRLMRDL